MRLKTHYKLSGLIVTTKHRDNISLLKSNKSILAKGTRYQDLLCKHIWICGYS